MAKKKRKLRATVEKVIKAAVPTQPDKAQINIEEADDLYREIRIENVVTDDDGQKAQLKPGEQVDLIVETDGDATTKKRD